MGVGVRVWLYTILPHSHPPKTQTHHTLTLTLIIRKSIENCKQNCLFFIFAITGLNGILRMWVWVWWVWVWIRCECRFEAVNIAGWV